MAKNPMPQPVVVQTVCSLCGEGWELHGDNPTTLDCIRLLKARIPTVTIAPYVRPLYPYNPSPWWYAGTSYTTCASNTSTSGAITVNYSTPDEGEPPQPIAA